MRKKMSWFTTALLIWLTLWALRLFIGTLASLLLGLWPLVVFGALATISYALAIAGVTVHYYRSETAQRFRWGPPCGIAGLIALGAYSVVRYLHYSTTTPGWSLMTSAMAAVVNYYVFGVLMTAVPLYFEYRKEGAPVAPAHVAQAVLSAPLSRALERRIESVEATVEKTRERLKKDLTRLTVALPLIFLGTILFAGVFPFAEERLPLIAIVFALFGIFFLIIAASFSSLLKKPRFVILSVNHSDSGLESTAAAEATAIRKDAKGRLVAFLLVYAYPFMLTGWLLTFGYYGTLVEQASILGLGVLMLSVLVCFLFGYWVLTQSSIGAIPLEESSLGGLLGDSVGVLPAKVRVGESHSVMMDFNIVAAVGGTALSAADAHAADSQRPHYEIELQAAGAVVDGLKLWTLSKVPATLKAIWSCSFQKPGTQALHLLLKAVHPVRARSEWDTPDRDILFAFTHDVRVDGKFAASADNVLSIISVLVTATSVIASVIIPFRALVGF